MSIPAHRLELIDTNVLVHVLRNKATGRRIQENYDLTNRPERPLLCSIVEGELLAFAIQRNWAERRRRQLNVLLDELVRVPSSHLTIISAYAEIDADAVRHGRPRGQNDIWIAATTKAVDAILLTCDTDFDWMQARHIEVCHVPTETS